MAKSILRRFTQKVSSHSGNPENIYLSKKKKGCRNRNGKDEHLLTCGMWEQRGFLFVLGVFLSSRLRWEMRF
jgi:hypothetical protein